MAIKKDIEEVLAWHTQKDHRENHVEWEESYTKTAEAVAVEALHTRP